MEKEAIKLCISIFDADEASERISRYIEDTAKLKIQEIQLNEAFADAEMQMNRKRNIGLYQSMFDDIKKFAESVIKVNRAAKIKSW